ncbi:MAG: prolyl aminopeptidase [Candidatus Marinimicrobia bacterium]|nr:prolyl aminopeptidase [Candidatus Neomarinimicrobiota bacterium]MCF7840575.1 prolyl aminopeptidase [Candidatus Neomarinimicrobiota bacterium]MCF7902141.1 prolyl aminopeptidase [Candidatus Neomarinimicrobiota bacterium]
MLNQQKFQLFPPVEPYNSSFLDVGDNHTLYFEEVGNPKGQPAIFVHGGPGGGISPSYRQYFNPEKYRLILFDQRGAGKSTPKASLENNTTWDLVSDMEKIRTHLKIDRWVVFGGSWGSTLSLAYAESHPQRVKGLILRGIFLIRKSEIDWFYQEGASRIFPDRWEKYLAPIPEAERHDLLNAYYKRLTSEDYETRLEAARAWSQWEASTSKLYTDPDAIDRFGDADLAEKFARIECHYFINKGFFDSETQLLGNVDKIRHIPAVIVQGRYDVVCPVTTAWDLHRAWPKADFHIIPDAGHSMSEPGILSKLVEYTEKFADLP